MKDLLKLVRQYKSDVEQRIICIQEERNNNPSTGKTIEDDYDAQIAHWEATLKEINEVLDRANYEAKLSITIISMLYDWVCPGCKRCNKGSGTDEKITCSGCNETFEIILHKI